VFALDAFGMDYGRDEQPSRRRLITIEQGAEREDTEEHRLRSLRDLGRHLGGRLFDRRDDELVLPGLHFAKELIEDILSEQLPEVFLKQFRDISDGRNAALQQIVETKMKVKRLEGFPLLHEYNVTIEPIDSQPLGQELGVENQTTVLGYRVEMDFVVEAGRVLWQAP
jgi:hypothetical protein